MESIRVSVGESMIEIERKGAHIRSLILGGIDVLMPAIDEVQTHGGCALLIPFANRVRNAEYEWEGKKFKLPKNNGKNSIHGLTRDIIWEQTASYGRIESTTYIENDGYPSTLDCRVIFELSSTSLAVKLLFRNSGKTSAPLSVGLHPYFRHKGRWDVVSPGVMKGLGTIDQYFPDGSLVDINPPRLSSMDERAYDNCFLVGSSVTLDTTDYALNIRTVGMDYFVVYNGKYSRAESVAVEPMTSAPDAFNNQIGLLTLDAGESLSCSAEFSLKK